MSEETIREHMNRILASPGFQNSDRLIRFLRFTVEAKLRGEGDQIKEYLIGREVFDRDSEYDPRLDPIVRVEARRLRKRLDEYYAATPDEAGALRIEFPKGSYAPEFRLPEPATVAPPSRKSWYTAAGIVAVVAALLIGFWQTRRSETITAVLPARWIWTAEEFPEIEYDEELAELTAGELANRHGATVTAWPLLRNFKGSGKTMAQIVAEAGANQALIIAVRLEAGGFRVTGFRIDPSSGKKLGVYDVTAQPLVTDGDRRKVAQELAAAMSRR
ncbi:MAG: hypothetical protein HY820_12630 [Acidobacteria bacterium]|nr:hypothetical protein [Acidobacteriota bacterium]